MPSNLSRLFQEPIDAVKFRERHTLEKVIRSRGGRIVLFGSGNLGRRAVVALRSIGIEPLAFSDNNSNRWNSKVEGIGVIPPDELARLYGANSTVLVTIWNEFHWFTETEHQMRSLGCDSIIPYTYLHWRFPEIFLPCLLNDQPHLVYVNSTSVLSAESIWADERSRELYCDNIHFRALGDPRVMPGRPTENTYLPLDILKFEEGEHFLDCGATIGEMTQEVLCKLGSSFATFHALEADQISYKKLQSYRSLLPERTQSKLHLYNFAVGGRRCFVRFSNTGETGSKIVEDGTTIECVPIDELFENTPVTFIKMDIEGAEFESLQGARKVIQRDQPILAICVYHTQSDIWRIPLFVRDLLPEHSLFLRSYEGDGYQNVLFAIPPRKLLRQSQKQSD